MLLSFPVRLMVLLIILAISNSSAPNPNFIYWLLAIQTLVKEIRFALYIRYFLFRVIYTGTIKDWHCWVFSIDDEVIDRQYRPLCSLKLKNSFLTLDHDKLTILASCLHLLSFLAPNPLKSGK